MKRKCPYCKTRIPADATVCRYCHRDIPAIQPRHYGLAKGLLLTIAFASGAATAGFLYGYFRERLIWENR